MGTTELIGKSARMRGHVVEFDEHRGLGVVSAGPDETYMFHCVELVDGTRTIAVGVAVEFDVRAKFSRPEAFSVTAV
jgi:CspA family cold shock protein